MKDFVYSNPTRIFFGRGEVRVTGKEIKAAGGHRVLICYGSDRIRDNGLLDTVTLLLEREGLDWVLLPGIQPNPRISSVYQGVTSGRRDRVDFILAIGGGSIIDAAKAVAAGILYEGDAWDFFSRGVRVSQALPVASILTLAATGSEMNGNAVISNPDTREKKAAHSELWQPVFSVLDPSLTYTVPPSQTAAGIADIMSHCLEQYFSPESDTYLVDLMTESVLQACIHYGPAAYRRGDDYPARSNLLWAGSVALNGLMSAGKSGDWAVHALEHELSARYDVTHGAGLAVLHPAWMEYVLEKTVHIRFTDLAVRVWHLQGGDSVQLARRGIQSLKDFFRGLGLPGQLRDFGIEKEALPDMARTVAARGQVGRFYPLEAGDIENIFELCY